MHVSLKHLIGTVTLMSLIISAGYSYTLITSYMEAQILRGQLQQIAEYVALNLVEVINLVKFSSWSSTEPTYKVLKLPNDLGGRAFMIELLNETVKGKGCYIRTKLVIRGDIEASSPIPINTTEFGIRLWYLNATESEEDRIETKGGYINRTNGMVYSGHEIVVWVRIEDTITAGLGILDRSGS
ncbi:MAG: hypothetical protein QXH67_04675 [Candidatus Bathyarchaeia archaeon]